MHKLLESQALPVPQEQQVIKGGLEMRDRLDQLGLRDQLGHLDQAALLGL